MTEPVWVAQYEYHRDQGQWGNTSMRQMLDQAYETYNNGARMGGQAPVDFESMAREAEVAAPTEDVTKDAVVATDASPAPSLLDDLETAWNIIANVTPWESQSSEWQTAAAAFRTRYFALIGIK